MKYYLRIIFFIVSLSAEFAFAQANSPSAYSKIGWKKTTGEAGEWTSKPIEIRDQDQRLIFLAVKLPSADITKAQIKSSESWSPVQIRMSGSSGYLLIPDSKGVLQLISDTGLVSEYEFSFLSNEPVFKISNTCDKLNFKIQFISQDEPSLPGIITCTFKGNQPLEIVFSTLDSAEWYGAGIFETRGKGERWKVFAAKDVLASPDAMWALTWGSSVNKNSVQIRFPLPSKKTPPTPASPLFFWVGTSYLSGTIEKGNVSSPIAGLVIPLRFEYKQQQAWWYMGTGYDFFGYATKKVNDTTNSTSVLQLWAGAEYKLGSAALRGDIGYLNRNLDAAGVLVTSTFEVTRYRGEFVHHLNTNHRAVGLSYQMGQTSTSGKFSETNMGVYYQDQMFFNKNVRFDITSTVVKASTKTIELSSQWINFGILFQF